MAYVGSATASSRRTFVILLLQVALHMSACGLTEAVPDLTVGVRRRHDIVDVTSAGSKIGVSSAAPTPPAPPVPSPPAPGPPSPTSLPAAVTYRPPVINFNYMGGPVLWKPIRLYFVWYGSWTRAEKQVVRTATRSLTPKKRIRQFPNLSGLWKVVTKYYQEPQRPGETRKYASNHVSIGGEVHDNYSFGRTIAGNVDPRSIIVSHLGQGLPTDLEQGVYFIFTSGDVQFSNDTAYCGYHSYQCVDVSTCDPFADDSNKIIFSFVPLPSAANGLLNGCSPFETPNTVGFGIKGTPPNHKVSPTGALDALIVTYLHELTELAVDPKVNVKFAWLMNLEENSETADLCSSNFIAGDWYYCDTPSLYPDFPASADCTSYYDNHAALTESKSSRTAFNMYGIDGSKFLAQLMWSLDTKGCASQTEVACSRRTVEMRKSKGTIQRGLFFRGVGLQAYAPGQNCSWKIRVRGAKCIRLTFAKVALGFDELDYVTVSKGNVVKKKVTGFGSNIKMTVSGHEATIRFVTFGGKSPYPSSAGFILHYEAGF